MALLLSLWSAMLTFGAKRLIGRVDSLELTKANKASTDKRFEDLMEERRLNRELNEKRFDAMIARTDKHMADDSERFRELATAINDGTRRLEDKISSTNAELAATNKALGEVIGELRVRRAKVEGA